MNTTLTSIVNRIWIKGGTPFSVGGFERDRLMGLPPKDMDIEVHGMNADTLMSILREFGKVDAVGASFGVIKLWTPEGDFDFSLPRRDNKVAPGHKGFVVEVDEALSVEQAAARRDFTINSMARNLITDELIDPFEGRVGIGARILRHTSPAFSEDPLRVLRGMQFAGRFNMRVDIDTREMCKNLRHEFHTLARERVWGEWEKWAAKSIKPSAGLVFLADTGWMGLFPELMELDGCPQDPVWHPEGDVLVHTMHVVDAMAMICDRDGIMGEDRVVRMFVALCHDFGKPATTEFKDGRWISPGHAAEGVEPTLSFLEAIGMPIHMRNRVVEMVREHMVHLSFSGSARVVRRFISRLKSATVADVMAVIEADHSGRPPLAAGMPEEARGMAEMAAGMGNQVKPILMGRHLIKMGVKPGVGMGKMLKAAFEAQLDGEFDDVVSGQVWLRNFWRSLMPD